MVLIKNLFGPSSGGGDAGTPYRHGHTGAYLAGLRHRVTGEELTITESGTHMGGVALREGTKPARADARGNPMISRRVVDWAMSKLGVDSRQAFAVARSVAAHGIGWPGGQSPIPGELPKGQRRVANPEWIVTIKNRYDIEKTAEKIGGLAVSYLDKA